MGQGMDGMNESWEPEDVEESQQWRVNTLLPEPQRLRIEADGLFKRAKKAEEKNKALTARAEASEKDAADCRAEYRDLFAKAAAMSDKLIAAESTVAWLRRALEEADKALEQVHDEWAEPTSAHDAGAGQAAAICFAASMAIEAAIAASPDEHARRIKSEALREMARLFMATANSDLSYHNRDLAARFCNAAASELEAENGKA